MRIAVLGAGLAGVTTAWYLSRDGHDVVVVDRQPTAGLETSFANGGQISVSHPEPWATPAAPGLILRWFGQEDAPLLFRLRLDPAQWSWGLAFLRECTAARAQRNTDAIAHLAMYSRRCLIALREETGIAYDHAASGILHTFWTARDWAHAEPHARMLRAYGMQAEVADRARCFEIEPALSECQDTLFGGMHAPEDETGDALMFLEGLAAKCLSAGVQFRFEHTVEGLTVADGRISHAQLRTPAGVGESLTADAFVLALGSYSRRLVEPLGEDLPIYPVKGYSITLPRGEGAHTLRGSITDESRRIVLTRLGDRVRIAGTAELNGFDTSINPQRCEAILRRARQIVPHLGNLSEAQFWAGLRPSTPSNVPILGRARLTNLWLNTGHGTLGWTLGCGSSRALANLISGREPGVDFPFRQG